MVEAVSHGASNAEIAEALGISVDTVKTTLRRAMARMGVLDRAHAARTALRQGWIR
jgi:DNA-binding NarL/FixJ family response regulator